MFKNILKNKQTAKMVVNIGLSLIGSTAIGFLIKGERHLKSVVDVYYSETPTEESPEQDN